MPWPRGIHLVAAYEIPGDRVSDKPDHRSVRYIPVMVLIPEECAEEFREFFERKRTGQATLHVDKGAVLATVCSSHKRVRQDTKP